MSIANAFSGVFQIFTLFSIGIIATRMGVLSRESSAFCSKLLMKCAIPLMLFENATRNVTLDFFRENGLWLLVPFLTQGVCLLAGWLCAPLFRIEAGKRGVFVAIFAMTNSVTIGVPVAMAIFGDHSIPFVTACYVANTLYFWIFCVPAIARDGTGHAPTLREKAMGVLRSPIRFFVLGSVFGVSGIALPSFLTGAAASVGGIVTPLSAMIIGNLFASLGRDAFRAGRVVWLGLIGRCLICPALALGICAALRLPYYAGGVFTLIMAMPVMNQTVIMAGLYGADDQSCAQALAISLLFSLGLIPALVALMNLLFA